MKRAYHTAEDIDAPIEQWKALNELEAVCSFYINKKKRREVIFIFENFRVYLMV